MPRLLHHRHTSSIRRRLLLWVAIPLLLLVLLNAWMSYRAALQTTQDAFDRLLVTSAHSLADLIWLERGELQVTMPHAALELYANAHPSAQIDAPNRSPLIYRVSFLDGTFLAGEAAIPPYKGLPELTDGHTARLLLYDTQLHEQDMRMAALWQPVESAEGLQYVVVQVGEYAAYRYAIGRKMLWQTLWQQSFVLSLALLTLWIGSSMVLKPLRRLAQNLEQRTAEDMQPLSNSHTPREILPVIHAFNGLIQRIANARVLQERFIADASHQLRTPLAVLQLHIEAGLRGDIPAQEALKEMANTTRRTNRVVHQLLMWNRISHGSSSASQPCVTLDLSQLITEVVIEQSPLLGRKQLDFSLNAPPAYWKGEAWMLQEILMNLLSNAIAHTPQGQALGIRLLRQEQGTRITVWDTGPGLSEQMQQDLYTPFVTGSSQGVGLGLAISRDLARACGGWLQIHNRRSAGQIQGLDATLWLPSAPITQA